MVLFGLFCFSLELRKLKLFLCCYAHDLFAESSGDFLLFLQVELDGLELLLVVAVQVQKGLSLGHLHCELGVPDRFTIDSSYTLELVIHEL